MKQYTDLIREATDCTAEEAPLVETIMRHRYSTLDHLDRRTFDNEAWLSLAALLVLKREDPDTVNFLKEAS